jgi:hypothetical protein
MTRIRVNDFVRHKTTGTIGLVKCFHGSVLTAFEIVNGKFVERRKACSDDWRATVIGHEENWEVIPDCLADPCAVGAQMELAI